MPSTARRTPRREAAPDRSYTEALERLFRRRRFGMRPGLEVIEALLAELGNPESAYPSVHIAGSKGKGSVTALVAEVLVAAGGPTGMYTSPHLQSYRERIRVDGVPISAEDVTTGLMRVEEAAAKVAIARADLHEPTFFELTTALAFAHFAGRKVRHAAIEVGLGGEFDATNVLRAPVAVISTIELEHTDVLGPTLTDVARAKAGILHPGMRAVTAEAKGEPLAEIERRAAHLGVPLWHLGREVQIAERELDEDGQRFTVVTPHAEHPRLSIPLLGAFQARNAALAVAAIDLFTEAVGFKVSDAALRRGLGAVRWRGRLERIAGKPALYLDAAHTPESARALAEGLGEIAPFLDPEENALLFGCLHGKRVDAMLEPLSTLARTLVLVPIRSDRSESVRELKRAALGRFPRIIVAPDAEQGLKLARAATSPTGLTVATGSDYLVGEILNALEGGPTGEPDLSDPLLRTPGQDERATASRRRAK
ncbi:MAG TPA: Mur ligase family protein [Thermoplasmata archaeon]|nr:Mur ligase family protein [Thermoplasmata archaeon]